MNSLGFVLAVSYFKHFGVKQPLTLQGEDFIEYAKSCKKPEGSKPIKQIYNKYNVSKRAIGNGICYKVGSKDKKYDKTRDKIVIYVHGGGYVMDASPSHWHLVSTLIDATNCLVYFPDYPLAPEHNYEDTENMMIELYKHLIRHHDPEEIIIMGDSAGGGISLATALCLKELELPQPKKYILISPSVDLDCNLPLSPVESVALEESDPLISSLSFDTICDLWRGNRERTDYHVTPCHGDLSNLAPITIFAGTVDVLTPFTKKMVADAKSKGIDIDFRLRKGMVHDYLLLPCTEAKPDIDAICEMIRS